jgi:Flp pilus assembly protein TadG
MPVASIKTTGRAGTQIIWRTLAGHFLTTRRGAAAVEFALTSFWLFLFLFAILNLGYLGFTLGVLQHAVEDTARKAAVTASANLSATPATACPNGSQIQSYFNNYSSPLLPAVGSASGPVLTPSTTASSVWTTGSLPGSYLALTATYKWRPIGFPALLGTGITLGITTVSFAMGTGTTACTD